MSFLSLFGRTRPYYHRDVHRCCRCRFPCPGFLWGILTLFVIFGVVILLVFIILRPSKPEFVLEGVAIYSLKVSSSPVDTVSASMQISLMSHNHNGRIGIHYREVKVFASYRGEQITVSAPLTPIYQGHDDVTVWSPFLSENVVSISPESATAMIEEINLGELLFAIKVDGKIKWKVGSWTSGTYLLSAGCPASIKSENLNATINAPRVASMFRLSQGCNVEVDS